MRPRLLSVVLLLLPIAAFAAEPCTTDLPKGIEVVLDFQNHVALIPEGTCVPSGLRISGAATRVGDVAGMQFFRRDAEQARLENSTRRPFTFAYAPDAAFARLRGGSRPVHVASESCFTNTFYGQMDPNCQNCSLTLYETWCTNPGPPPTYQQFQLTVSDELDFSGGPDDASVSLGSTAGYISCSASGSYPSSALTCSSSDFRQWTGSDTDHLHSIGFAEWLQWGNLYDVEIDGDYSPIYDSVHTTCGPPIC